MHYIFCSSLSYTTGLFRPVNQLSTISLLVEVVDSSDTTVIILFGKVQWKAYFKLLHAPRNNSCLILNIQRSMNYKYQVPKQCVTV